MTWLRCRGVRPSAVIPIPGTGGHGTRGAMGKTNRLPNGDSEMRTTVFRPYVMVREDGEITIDWCDTQENSVDAAGNDVTPPPSPSGYNPESERLDAILTTGEGLSEADKLRRLADYLDSSTRRAEILATGPVDQDHPLYDEGMMRFTLSIDLGTVAMSTANDVANALRNVATRVDAEHDEGTIMDGNGNTVGRWAVEV